MVHVNDANAIYKELLFMLGKHDAILLLERAEKAKEKIDRDKKKALKKRGKDKEKRKKEREERGKERERKEREREEKEKKRQSKATTVVEQQAKEKQAAVVESEHAIVPPLSLSSSELVAANPSPMSSVASSEPVVTIAKPKPIVVASQTAVKKEDATYLAECMRVRSEFLELRILTGLKASKKDIMGQHEKTLKGTLSRKAFSDLTATYMQDLQAIAAILVANKSSPSLSKFMDVISVETKQELIAIETYRAAFPPPKSTTSDGVVELGVLPSSVDLCDSSAPIPAVISPRLSPLAKLQQDLERMKKEAAAIELDIKEKDEAVVDLQKQLAVLREKQPKLIETIQAAERRLSELEVEAREEQEAAARRVEEERARADTERKKLAAATGEQDEDASSSEEEPEMSEEAVRAQFLLFKQFLKSQKKTAKTVKKPDAASSEVVAGPLSSTVSKLK